MKSNRFDSYKYIENEFFNVDSITFNKIAELYRFHYGDGPYRYLLKTYNSWKSGHVSRSSETLTRIIKCVPRFLSDEKRFVILKNEILNYIENLYFEKRGKVFHLSDVNDLFIEYAKLIDKFSQSNLLYLVSKTIFSEQEIEEFINVAKYMLYEKLKLALNQFQIDYNLIKEKLSSFKFGVFDATYIINLLGTKIDLYDIYEVDIKFMKLKDYKVSINSIYRKYAENYIIEETKKIKIIENDSKNNFYKISSDLENFLNQYHKNSKIDDRNINFPEFKGVGGVLLITFEITAQNINSDLKYFIEQITRTKQKEYSCIKDLNLEFESYIKRIDDFNETNFSFIKKAKVTPVKIQQLILICKYALYKKLSFVYNQVEDDFKLIKYKLSNFKNGVFKANYVVDFLNIKLDISDINNQDLFFLKLRNINVSLCNSYKIFADQFILEEMIQMNFIKKDSEIKQFIKSNDLDFLIKQYNLLKENNGESSLKCYIEGKAGQLYIEIEVVPIRKIYFLLALTLLKLFFYLLILSSFIYLCIKFEFYKIVIPFIFSTIIVCAFLSNEFNNDFRRLKELKINLYRYGK